MNGQSLQKSFVPLPGGGTAVYTSAGLVYYRHTDWLGSSRFASTPTTRSEYFDVAYAPYGEDYADSGTADLDFTGQNQDTVSSLYDFMYREYHPNSGRWIQPDPAGLAASDASNPQSWNRYAYVGNNPVNAVDLLGLINDCLGCVDDNFDNPNAATYYINGVQVLAAAFNGAILGQGGSGLTFAFAPGSGIGPVPAGNLGAFGDWQYISGYQGQTNTYVNGSYEDGTIYTGNGQWVLTPAGALAPANNCQPPFVCTTQPNLPVVKKPPTPTSTSPKSQQNGCFAARLIHNFGGSDGRVGVTLTLNIGMGLAVREIGTKAAASLLPGPGWVYVGAATLWDFGMVGEAYFHCRNGAPEESGGNPEAEE